MFTKPMFMTSSGFSVFRKKILHQYEYCGGFIMDSCNFADVKSWGLSFTIWKNKENV